MITQPKNCAMASSSKATPIIDFIALSFLIALSLALAILAYSFGGVDFGVYYAAGRVFLQGGNPYDYSQLVTEIVSSTGAPNNPYYYAPWFTWALTPLALLPFETARILWALLNFIFWFWGLFNLSKLIAWPLIGWRRWGMYLLVTFVFAWGTWGSEQVGVLIFLILTFMTLSLEREKWLSGGIWMALLLFKPNITAFPVIALTVWLILRGKWKPVVSMAGALMLMAVLSLLVSPGWYLELLQPDKVTGLSYTLSESGFVQVQRYTTTMLNWLSAYGIIGITAYAIYAIAALAGLLVAVQAIYKARSITQLMAVVILVNFALVPYALFYDYPSLVLTLFLINAELSTNPKMIWIQGLMNGLVLSSLFVGDNITYRYWIVVVIIFFAILGKVIAAGRHEAV
ncbi:MAG: DUF2029 domain-containing protein [Chloroflexi bacterium]|nr:DUF2029 domain-containing protein [Chloroflexota bacterium]